MNPEIGSIKSFLMIVTPQLFCEFNDRSRNDIDCENAA